MRYWIYKNNFAAGGPTGYWGHWDCMFFTDPGPSRWGGTAAFRSAEVHRYLDEVIARGDVMVCYQTDAKAVIGFAAVDDVVGPLGKRELILQPLHCLDEPFKIHQQKRGTILERDPAVNGRPAIRELDAPQMEAVVRLSGAPRAVLQGQPGGSGWIPPEPCRMAFTVQDASGCVEVEVRWWDDPPTFSVREVTLDARGDRASVAISANVRTLADAIDASEATLSRIQRSAKGQVGWVLAGYEEQSWISLADDDGFVVGRGDDDEDYQEVGYGATIPEALQDVAPLIEQITQVNLS